MIKYHPAHSWVRFDGGPARVGLTALARERLGEVIYVDLPAVGTRVKAGGRLGELESTKTMAELVSPLSGEVVEANLLLEDNLDWINGSPEERGWLAEIRVERDEELDNLLSRDQYLARAGQED